MKKLTLLALLTSFISLTAFATQYDIDPTHSNVQFTVKHLISRVTGEFTDFAGKIDMDVAKPTDAKIDAKIKISSINTKNEKRDGHLKSEDFFYAEKFPEMSFVSKQIKKAGNGKYKMMGDLTMRGVTKPVTLDVEFLGHGKDPWGNDRVGFSASGKVNRKDFGISWNKALDAGGFVLGDDVMISINVEAATPAKKM